MGEFKGSLRGRLFSLELKGRGDHEVPGVIAFDAEAIAGVIVARVIGRVSLCGLGHGDGVARDRGVASSGAGVCEEVGLAVGEPGDAAELEIWGGLEVDTELTAEDGVTVDGHEVCEGEGFVAAAVDGVGQVIDRGVSSAGV